MICECCGNVTENKRAVGMYMRLSGTTHIDCPECGCALSMKEIRAAVREYKQQFEETRYNYNHDSKGRRDIFFCRPFLEVNIYYGNYQEVIEAY